MYLSSHQECGKHRFEMLSVSGSGCHSLFMDGAPFVVVSVDDDGEPTFWLGTQNPHNFHARNIPERYAN